MGMTVDELQTQMSQLAAGLAHKIRNPLHAISLNLHVFQRCYEREGRLPSVEVKAMVEQSLTEVQRVDHLIREMITFAVPGAPRNQTLNVTAELASLLPTIVESRSLGDVRLETRLPGENLMVEMDSRRLSTIVQNLLQNAKESIQEHGKGTRIDVELCSVEGWARLTIADDGPGVLPADRERIFEPFYSTRKDSAGLGLTIAKRFVQELDGRIEYKSNAWGGASFVVTIPQACRR